MAGNPSGAYPIPNAEFMIAGRKRVAAANTTRWADYLDDIGIPDGFSLVLKADLGNAGLILLARSGPDAISLETSWPLSPGEAITYYVKNSQAIWFSGTVAGDFLYYTVEMNTMKRF